MIAQDFEGNIINITTEKFLSKLGIEPWILATEQLKSFLLKWSCDNLPLVLGDSSTICAFEENYFLKLLLHWIFTFDL